MTAPSAHELNQAIESAHAGQQDQAITLLRQVLKQDPDHMQALLWLGGLSPNTDEGIIALERALQLDPGNEAARRGLANLRGRQQSRAQGSESTGPQHTHSLSSQPSPETASSPEPEPAITGGELLRLAGSVVWPFKGLKRPLGELLAEGVVQSRDLGWAVWKAYDPTVKWAAAIHLRARALREISLSPDKARQVMWQFKDLNQPIGELLAEHTITLHDLAWAVANAYDPQVREAAAIVGAGIVRRTLPSAGPSALESSGTGAEAATLPADTSEAEEEAPSQAGSADEALASEGQLQIVEGSTYLREQEEQKAQQRTSAAWIGALLLLAALVLAMWATLFLLVGVKLLFMCGLVVAMGLIGAAGLLMPRVQWLRTEEDNFAVGRIGEETIAAALQEHLNEQWTLFRNVLLPDEYGDIDAVLIGPKGIYVLEVKTYSGYNRNVGERWQRRAFGFWHTLPQNPSRQAKRNAKRLHDYLYQRGVEVWVEPRVVWAGGGKLWLEGPAVRVWQLTALDYILGDIKRGKTVPTDVLSAVNAALSEVI